MNDDTLAFTAGGVSYSLDLTVNPADDVVSVITLASGGPNIEVSYENSSQTVVASGTTLENIDISFVSNGVDYEFFTHGTGYVMWSGPKGQETPLTVTNVNFACFAEGTRIRTERGDVAVEELRVGDLAVTASGAKRPIKWLGHRRVDCAHHPRAGEALPIRIRAHAFGPDRPSRDLYMSPGHALCVAVLDEVLIYAGSLVNDTTIQQIEVDSVVYWHVELDSHDILLAENLPAESYLEMENRGFFVENGIVSVEATPDLVLQDRRAAFRHPLHEGGPIVDAVRAQLFLRALAQGWRLEREPFNDLHLVVDGQRLDPLRDGLRATFDVPTGAREIRLVSRASKPCHLPGDNRDARSLGVCLRRLSVGDTEVALDDPRLQQGFHRLETEGWGAFRWTTGNSLLPASLIEETPGARRFSLDMLLPPLPFWVAPAAASRQSEAA